MLHNFSILSFSVISFISYTKILRTLSRNQVQVQDHIQQQSSQTTALNMARYREAVCSALWEQLVLVVCYAPGLTLSTLVIIWRTYSLHLLVTSGITTLSVCFKVHPDAFEYVNFHPCQAKGKGFVRGETQCLLWEDSSCSMFNKNIQCFKYAHKNRNTKVEVLRNVSLNLISPGEKGHSKTYLGKDCDRLKTSKGHPGAEGCYLFDFPPICCMAGPLRTRCCFLARS